VTHRLCQHRLTRHGLHTISSAARSHDPSNCLPSLRTN
jgi:hypothetical protein